MQNTDILTSHALAISEESKSTKPFDSPWEYYRICSIRPMSRHHCRERHCVTTHIRFVHLPEAVGLPFEHGRYDVPLFVTQHAVHAVFAQWISDSAMSTYPYYIENGHIQSSVEYAFALT